jgi:two-component system response regulator HydG
LNNQFSIPPILSKMVSLLKDKIDILIVDDDVDMAETLSDILIALGIQVEIAHDGCAAIEKTKAKMFDIVLMDIKMPNMNGVESYKKIKQIRPQTTVVLMTAFAAQDLVAEALKEGAYGVWYKPVEIHRIVELVENTPKKGALLLIIDDDLSTCETLVDILQKKGYRLTQVSSGEEAKMIIKERDFDLVFVDVKMPVINGLETYLELRKIRPEIKAIMITAYRQEVDSIVEEAIRNDLYTCLYKPIDVDNLLKIVEKVLALKPKTESQKIGEIENARKS